MFHSLFYKHYYATKKSLPNLVVMFCFPKWFNLNGKTRGTKVSVIIDGLPTRRMIRYNDTEFIRKLADVETTADILSLLEEHSVSS